MHVIRQKDEPMGSTIRRVVNTFKERSFLFEQLVKRDFEKRYKGTILGMAWSILSPLLQDRKSVL